ncbi:protein crumbs [Caerostris extrusa]|uniref:Protein crumbs n=1 Tax=Caerostris extrusa TaxID=172846 RepID=A0AAV4XKZ5_CAEEX|nr:protein crumbs [Caerostris extrusa]
MALMFVQKLNVPDFIGCIQDIYINGDIIIPNDNSVLHGAKEGCHREEQCEGSPCHNGFCKDNWLSYECVCPRPFFGTTCEYSYEAATFGYQNQNSRAELLLPEEAKSALSDHLAISFFARTRNGSGLLFYVGPVLEGSSNCTLQGMHNDTFILARLISGNVQVVLKQPNGEIIELTHHEKLDNGNNYYIEVSTNNSILSLKVNETIQSKPISGSSICLEALYIADLPTVHRQKRQALPQRFTDKIDILLLEDIPFFKGIIQDFRINDEEVVFYELTDQGVGFPKVFGKAILSDTVQKGVVSDDPCNTIYPCLHGSECKDVWNEYVCICPEDYRGKNCEERKPCADNNCPTDSECRNLKTGYECVASAAFNGKQSGIHYQIQNTNHTFMNISFSFRSNSSGTILWIDSNPTSDSDHFLHIEMVSHTLEVKWDLGPSRENEAFHKTVSQKIESDKGDWHHVKIWFDGNLVHLKVSGNSDNLSEDNYSIGLSELLNGGANVYLGYKPGPSPAFKGCLKDVRIGGVLLSFFDSNLYPSSGNPFHIVNKDLEIGCKLCWDEDCEHGSCYNRTDSYDCSCYDGYEGQYCEVDMCDTKNPCVNGGFCSHSDSLIMLMCSCPKGFTGPTCNEVDLCELAPCYNGGTCSQISNETTCTCPPYYEGELCEKSIIRSCNDVTCLHGNCLNIDLNETIKFKCMCYDGYEGELCDKTIDFCLNNPCQNQGTCDMVIFPDSASYHCFCPSGFTGDNCEKNVNECETSPCDHGLCVDEIGHFRCYMGDFCSEPIRSCNDTGNVCYNGTCENASGGYRCQCGPQFLGAHCSIFNECHPSKCNHQGECEPMYDENELMFIHTCACNDGFSGHDCTKELVRGGDDPNLILIILIPVMSLFLLCLLIGSIIFLRIAKKKRATRGTYSPSRQEMFGSRVEMNHVMKPPPEERLI